METLEAKRLAAPRANLDNLAFIVSQVVRQGTRRCGPHRAPFYRISGAGPYQIVVTAIELHVMFFIWRIRLYGVQQHTVCRTRLSITNGSVVCESASNYEMLFTPTLSKHSFTDPRKNLSSMKSLRVYFNGSIVEDLARRSMLFYQT